MTTFLKVSFSGCSRDMDQMAHCCVLSEPDFGFVLMAESQATWDWPLTLRFLAKKQYFEVGKEFKYLGFMFMSFGEMEQEVDRWMS